MKRLLFSCLVALFALNAIADDDYNERFTTALKDSFPLAKEILAEWDLKGPKNGDYYAAHFNIHHNQALKYMIGIDNYVPLYANIDELMPMTDSLGNKVGYIRQNISLEKPEELDSAITWIKKGIEKCPQRLDLRIGYSTLYRMLDDAEKMYSIMEQTVNWVLANPNTQYTWTSDQAIEKEPVISDSMQDYFSNCYYSTAHKDYAEKFADLGLRFSPNSAVFWNDKAVLKLDKDDLQGALELMQKALTFNPDDDLIKENIKHMKNMIKEQEEEKKKDK